MLHRPLGKTGLQVSVIGLGCAPLGNCSTDRGVAIARHAYELGVTYFDVAAVYDDAEVKVGIALEDVRDRVVLSTKTSATTYDAAWRDINQSLVWLRTDYVDNLHLHAIRVGDDLDARMSPNGALRALQRAKDEGLTRHIGCTSHQSASLITALERFPFEVILVPMNIVEREPLERLIPLCQELGVGVTTMKPLGTGIIPPRIALRWLVNQPIATAVPGAISVAEVEENVVAGAGDLSLSEQEQREVEAIRRRLDKVRCRICQRCEPCPKGISIGMTLGTDMIWDHWRNMGVDAFRAMNWGRLAMEIDLPRRQRLVATVEECDGCGLCERRCPYGLQVISRLREMLPGHREIIALWQERLDVSAR